MAERLRIVISASKSHPDLLTVQDALEQVLDYFLLLALSDDNSSSVVWKLRSASTNTPFTVEGEAVSAAAGVDVSVIARAQKAAFARDFEDVLSRGIIPDSWTGTDRAEIAQRVLNRNVNGIGETDIFLDHDRPKFSITAEKAAHTLKELSAKGPYRVIEGDRAREEIGSLEGKIIEAKTVYNKPAIRIADRKTGAWIWCIVPEELMNAISEKMKLADVWKHERVSVRGKIVYASDGSVDRVFADTVTPVVSKEVPLSELLDRNFTNGMSAAEYLEKLREGELGE